jgi:hypothetical protein|nr:MAG TPA: helix-turn-helix domain protein [Caudoviricetes sp.]
MTNLAFTALIKSKGYNQKSLAEETGIPPGVLSHRINSRDIWTWPEVSAVCAALGITYDEFATYYPVANVHKSGHAPIISQADLEALKSLRGALSVILKGA